MRRLLHIWAKDIFASAFLGQRYLGQRRFGQRYFSQRHFGQSDVLPKVTFRPKTFKPKLLNKKCLGQRHFCQFHYWFFWFYPIFQGNQKKSLGQMSSAETSLLLKRHHGQNVSGQNVSKQNIFLPNVSCLKIKWPKCLCLKYETAPIPAPPKHTYIDWSWCCSIINYKWVRWCSSVWI